MYYGVSPLTKAHAELESLQNKFKHAILWLIIVSLWAGMATLAVVAHFLGWFFG